MGEDQKIMMKHILGFLTVIFAVFELLVASGVITIEQWQGFLSNLAQGGANWYLNPIPITIGVVLIVNLAGYMENVVIQKQTYDINKFAETWFKYLPLITLISQARPIQEAVMWSTVIDIITRALKTRKPTPEPS